jgi:hypothetical protein
MDFIKTTFNNARKRVSCNPKAPSTETCHFLALPPEIRNEIYAIFFNGVGDRVIIPLTKRYKHHWSKLIPHPAPGHHLALLQTNKQIRAEAHNYVFTQRDGIHAELYSPEVFFSSEHQRWKLNPALFSQVGTALNTSVRLFGNRLQHITTLHIRGEIAFSFLFAYQPDEYLRRALFFRKSASGDKEIWYGHDWTHALYAFKYLPNVRVILLHFRDKHARRNRKAWFESANPSVRISTPICW